MRTNSTTTAGMWDRLGPVCGIMAAVTYVAAQALFPLRGLGVRPEDPAARIAAAISGRLEEGTAFGQFATVLLLLLAVFFLFWFVADVHQRLQRQADEAGQWIATVFLAGGLALVAALLIQGFVGLVQITLVDFGTDAQVAKTLLTLGWIGFAVVIPGAAAMTSAAALLTFRFGALPTSVGMLAVVTFLATFAMYWVPAWLLWVLVTAVVLLGRAQPAPASRPAGPTAAVAAAPVEQGPATASPRPS